jgi:hypothetical protein
MKTGISATPSAIYVYVTNNIWFHLDLIKPYSGYYIFHYLTSSHLAVTIFTTYLDTVGYVTSPQPLIYNDHNH